MLFGGLLKFSLIDYPGKVAAVVFTQGCNFRCPFCHNPELVLPDLFNPSIAVEEVLSFMEKRKGQLQGLVVTGGEPTLHAGLADFLAKVRAMGFLVKLDTNGSRPDVLRALFNAGLVNYVAMDVKSSPEHYARAAGVEVAIADIRASIEAIKVSGVEHEFRTTALKSIVALEDMESLMRLVGPGEPYGIRRGNLKARVLDYNAVADKPDYTDEEWAFIKTYDQGRRA
jgi:pyruvate formate lyase activating enzyme